MKIFDEDGNYLGEFIQDSVDDLRESAVDTFNDGDWVWGLILLLVVFPLMFILGHMFSLLWKVVKWTLNLILNCVWWLVRLPFTLVIYREVPEF